MNIFAIADLHLSGQPPAKPMDKFGSHWQGHWEKIKLDWSNRVREDDVVLLAGDTSWGMRWSEAAEDLEAIIAMPGRKILIRGNHDYWWQTISKMAKQVGDKLTFLQNTFTVVGDWAVCGSRGWTFPGEGFSKDDESIYLRELGRIRLSLEAARAAGHTKIILMLHYPPADVNYTTTGFTELLAEYAVSVCVYGHLHAESAKAGPTGVFNGTRIQLVACDAINFRLCQIIDENGRICLKDGE